MSTTTKHAPAGFWPLLKAGRGGITSQGLTDRYGPGAALSIRAEVSAYGDSSTQDPHFSVTGEVVTTESRRRRDIQSGGCLHDEALEYWPELAPIVALHLSSARTGAPMYAEANGFYQLAGALGGLGERYHAGNGQRQHWKGREFDGYRLSTPEECLQSFADHVRVPLDEARSLSQRLDQETEKTPRRRCGACHGDGLAHGVPCSTCGGNGEETAPHFIRRRWHEECADMAPRWAREAREGLIFMWEHASPPDLRETWREQVREVLGVELIG